MGPRGRRFKSCRPEKAEDATLRVLSIGSQSGGDGALRAEPSMTSRLVTKVRGEASFDLLHRAVGARGIIFHLVTSDLADTKIFRLRMRKVESADAGSRIHCEGLGELDPTNLLRIKQSEQRPLFRMIRAGRVTRGGSDAAIFLVHQVLRGQVFITPESPGLTRDLVRIFGEGFRQAIGQRFQKDRAVIVVLCSKLFCDLIGTDACGDCESADVV